MNDIAITLTLILFGTITIYETTNIILDLIDLIDKHI